MAFRDNPQFRTGLERFREQLAWRAKDIYDNYFAADTKQIVDKLPADLSGLDQETTPAQQSVAIGKALRRF
ncbi:MAG: hypothetical protein AAF213_09440 [Pseudomonadota bacterium]